MAKSKEELNRSFQDTAAKFLRENDPFASIEGWVERFDGVMLWVNGHFPHNLMVGEMFEVNLFGRDENATFMALLRDIPESETDEYSKLLVGADGKPIFDGSEDSYLFMSMGGITFSPPNRESRFVVHFGTVVIDGYEGRIRDISHSGIGMEVDIPIPAGTYPIEIHIGGSTIAVEAKAVYCRCLSEQPPLYRIGIELLPMNRLHAARWTSFLQSAA